MKIITYSLGELQANCYFIIEGDDCAIIDPGDEAHFILEELQIKKLKLRALIATHGHFDHIMAVGEIQLSLDVPFYIHQKDQFLVQRVLETARYFLKNEPAILEPRKVIPIQKGDLIINSQLQFNIIHTPGHTPGSCSFFFQKNNIVFTGDTLFAQGGVGRTDFSYGKSSDLKQSLHALLKLPKNTVIYPGHGEQTSIKESRTYFSLK